MGKFHKGRVCPRHPELKGKRYSNNTCPKCAAERHARNQRSFHAMSKYDVIGRKKTRLLDELKLDHSVPVKYAKAGTYVAVSKQDAKIGIKRHPMLCGAAQAHTRQIRPLLGRKVNRNAFLAKVCLRSTALVGLTAHGKPVVTLYATGTPGGKKIDKFDKDNKMIDHYLRLLQWPQSWFPGERRKMRAKRLRLQARGRYKPRKYNRKRGKHPKTGLHRINSVFQHAKATGQT